MKKSNVSFWERVLDNLGIDTPIGACVFALVVCICLFIILL